MGMVPDAAAQGGITGTCMIKCRMFDTNTVLCRASRHLYLVLLLPVCTEHVYLLHNSPGEVVFVFARGKMSRVVAPSQEMRLQAPFAV